MGHATRSIPIIKAILHLGHQIVIGSDGRSLALLRKEFPDEIHLELPSYNIRYGSSNMVINMAFQLPRITYAAFAEHLSIRKWVREYQVDYIISDNRFGCFHPKVPSFFMTHQLQLQIEQRLASFLGNQANRFWIRRYHECWVPDFEGSPNISGVLSHPAPFGNVRYIGPLTRMKKQTIPKRYLATIILSGPEPQRTYLEKILSEQAQGIKGNILLVKGKTEAYTHEKRGNLETISYLTSKELNEAICASEVIISRSGYSTLMDLSVLGSKAILIPTPGQTEQEILARHFHEQGIFLMQSQDNINLARALEEVREYKGMVMPSNHQLEDILSDLLGN